MVRGIERRDLFCGHADREDFLERLDQQVTDGRGSCFAWALLPNHVHLVLRTGERSLSDVMRRLDTGYARGFNLRHGRSGYVFQNRFRSILVEDDAYLRVLIRYVHRNPIEAGLVRSLEELESYPWSGHAGLMGRRPRGFHAVREVLGWFGPDAERARHELLRWMREPERFGGHDARPDLTSTTAASDLAPGVAAPRTSAERAGPSLPEVRSEQLRRRGWTLERLIDWVCREQRVDPARVRRGAKSRGESRARALIGCLAIRELGCTLREVSRSTGVSPGAMSRAVYRIESTGRWEAMSIPPAPCD
jgi:REP element-mobilizing transposase RayT